MPIRPLRTALVAGAAAAALVLTAGPALAHVEPDPGAIPAGEATTVALTIGHGCDESPTTSVAVQLPEGLDSVSGVATSGWAIDSSGGAVTWIADTPLPSEQEQVFELELTPAADQAGQTLYLKTVQTCEEGELRWIEEWDGEGEEPEHPAPALEVLAAGDAATAAGDHHAEEGGSDHAETTDTTEADHHAEDTATTEAGHHEEEAASSDSSDDGGSDAGTVALVVLVIAAIGLGGIALVRHRRSTP